MVRSVSGQPGSADIQYEKSTSELVSENVHVCDDCGARFLEKRGLSGHRCDSDETTDSDSDDSIEVRGDPPYFTASVRGGFEAYHTRRDCHQLEPSKSENTRDEDYIRYHKLSPCPACVGGDD